MPVGAEPVRGGVSFRVWAPKRGRVAVEIDGRRHDLVREEGGYFSGTVPGAGPGARYGFRLDDDERLYPDPASRFQPEGPHGPSEVVDPDAFRWTDAGWPGIRLDGQVVYEMHVGTFTPEGTWRAAIEKLPHLKELGVTVVEMMPVAEFPGRFGWGYDGVDLFAPTRLYGRPEDLKAFIDAAHRIGIGVIHDVVYNHLGPDGNYLACFSPTYFSDRYETEWGDAINFDGPDSAEVRTFFLANAAYWIGEFHFDGLRLDATQSIFDSSPVHILREIAETSRRAAGPRSIILIGENEPQETRLVRPVEAGGYGLDALWNDDLHHSAMVALTGRAEAYYEDHDGSPQEFISAAKYGYLFQGQFYFHQGKNRGTPGLDLPPAAFVNFLQNHDQIANSAAGLRLQALSHPGQARALTALTLLLPGTPMLFQGQEFWASTPFFYFADHEQELARLVRDGRIEFVAQFPSVGEDAETRARLADPGSEETFRRSKLDWSEAASHAGALALHRDLIALRRTEPALARQERGALDGAVLGERAFVLRFLGAGGGDRLLLVNLGPDLVRRSIAEPLLAPPPAASGWALRFSTENPRYGGQGTPKIITDCGWRIPAHSSVLLAPALD
ncbi:malto-oligosyltrehalose trehalohydrolase [Enterovirga sp. DB1703]|uniref:Malto-oligosyltrehalose trehalohydrolase n=2 Tax=Enterovirga aerilata TaxID=2730920 RepID=A0A849IC31_9HYPH|nr:malto-oligosyltrehalose trehalohydrolase [Enterovirga sp. DB1703]